MTTAYLAPAQSGGRSYLAPATPPAAAPAPVSQAVTWTTTIGTISSTGVFTAPAATSAIQTGVVTATSVQDPTKSGSASVTVPAAVVITPPGGGGGTSPTPGTYTITLPAGASLLIMGADGRIRRLGSTDPITLH